MTHARTLTQTAEHGPSRRLLLSAGLGLAAACALRPARAAAHDRADRLPEIRLARAPEGRGSLERALKPLGVAVEWAEFPSGPPLMEALNAGAIDFGSAGEAPPIFAQAASTELRYVAAEPPAPKGEAILVPKGSPIQSLADLRGKTIAFNKGSNVHYLLVRALEKAGIPYDAVKLAYLGPADANAAFVRGSVDAWAIWDPYFAAAERATARGCSPTRRGWPRTGNSISPGAASRIPVPEIVDEVLKAIGEIDAWAAGHADTVAAELAPSVGIPAPVLAVALGRLSYGVAPLDEAAVADQQRIADTFHTLGLLPKPLRVAARCGPRRRRLPADEPRLDPLPPEPSRDALASAGDDPVGLAGRRLHRPRLEPLHARSPRRGEGGLGRRADGRTLDQSRRQHPAALAGFAIGGSIGFALGLANGLSRVSETLTIPPCRWCATCPTCR